jgi:hypothetical protein
MKYCKPILLVLYLGASIFMAAYFTYSMREFVIDDAFITSRYAKHLAEGHGPVWNAGVESVEGYTNLSYMLLEAVFESLGVGAPTYFKLLGGFSICLLLLGAWRFSILFGMSLLWRLVLLSTIVANSYIILHALSGLETILFSALIMLFVLAIEQDVSLPRPPYGLGALFWGLMLIITRPEGIVVVCGAIGALALFHQAHRKRLFLYFIGFCVAVLLLTAWRWSFYHDLLPNTFYLNTSLPIPKKGNCLDLLRMSLTHLPFTILACLSMSRTIREYRYFLFACSGVVILLAYYTTPSLKMNYSHRFFVPFLPVVLALSIVGFEKLFHTLTGPPRPTQFSRYGPIIVVLIGAFILASQVLSWHFCADFGRIYGQGLRQTHCRLGLILAQHARRDATLAVGDAGAIPYFSDLETIDYIGLNDRHIARHRSHLYKSQKDLDYVLNMEPEFLVLVSSGHSGFTGFDYGIRRIGLDFWEHPKIVEYSEVARRQMHSQLGYKNYHVVLMVHSKYAISEDFFGALRSWTKAPVP